MNSFALLFPGQGAQSVGMGKDLAQQFPPAKALFEKADALLGIPLSRICFEGPQSELTRTEICQPALYVTSLAALAALQSAIRPAAAAGLSLGEYTALAAAGAFSFEEGLKLVRLRGQAMEEASRKARGTMASVLGLELEALEPVCAEAGAQVANINSPGQIVISGPPEAVERASLRAKERGAKRVIPLEVGGAFHSRLMEPASVRLKQALETIPVRDPQYPVVSNVTGSYHQGAAQIKDALATQLTHPVRWEQCMRTLLESGIRTFLEVGPGSVLKGLLRKIDPQAQVWSVGTAQEVRAAGSTWA